MKHWVTPQTKHNNRDAREIKTTHDWKNQRQGAAGIRMEKIFSF
jgi:hypothetical protein